jgi:hypothetical protein
LAILTDELERRLRDYDVLTGLKFIDGVILHCSIGRLGDEAYGFAGEAVVFCRGTESWSTEELKASPTVSRAEHCSRNFLAA